MRHMRYPAEHKQHTRDRIVRAAARRFRGKGSESAIADLMRDLKLTHGGFYRHFDSKDDLFGEAFAAALEETRQRFGARVAAAPPGGGLKAFIDAYLDPEHCEHPERGCPVAAMAPELGRRPRSVRAVYQKLVEEHIRHVARIMPGRTAAERERKTMVLLSGMAGALAAARLLADDESRRTFLESARQFFLTAAMN